MDALAAFDGPPALRRLLRALSPPRLASRVGRLLPRRFLPVQIYLDSLARPEYAYGLYVAAWQAKALGHRSISAIELGVASGCGLLALQSLAMRIGGYFNVGIEIHGFDTGHGLPKPQDYRDQPYLWQAGDYGMDA
jgi:hypothetical protein